MKKYVKTFESFNALSKSKEALMKFYDGFRYEIKENTKLRKIIYNYMSGDKLTDEEKVFVKDQSMSIIKMLGLGTLVILPGATVLIPALVIGAKKMGIELLPKGFRMKESMSSQEMVDIIQDGKRIYVNYINGYNDHNKNLGYKPVDINDNGEISLDIDGKIYSTELKWVVGIDELSHYEVEPHMVQPPEDPTKKIDNYWKNDKDFLELLRDQGGLKGIKKRMKEKYGLDYSKVKNIDQLYQQLNADQMM